MHFSTHRKKTKGHFFYNMLKKKPQKQNQTPNTKPFWKLGLLYLDYLLKHLHEFCGVEKRTRVNLKTILLLLLCMH